MDMNRHNQRKRFVFSTTVLVAGLLFLMSSTGIHAEEAADISSLKQTSAAFAKIARDVSPAVVNIQLEIAPTAADAEAVDPLGMLPFPGQPNPNQGQRMVAQGSGFIIRSDGYIVTNNHVVENASKITVKLLDEREYEAKVIGTDPHSDIAVIKIPAKDLPTVTLGDSDKVQVGEWVVAMGNPLGLSHSLSAGIISAVGRNSMGIANYESFIQTDAAINMGNSGGPLIDLEGNVIGINTAILTRSGGYMGIGFAIPINMAKSVIDQLMKDGKVVRGYLGIKIQPLTQDLADSFGSKTKHGVLVVQTMKDGPADKGGLKQGDVITNIDGNDVKNMGTFRNDVAAMKPATQHKFTIIRQGKPQALLITVGDLEASAGVAVTDQIQIVNKLGLSIQNITPDIAPKIGVEAGSGVVIAEVKPNSIAQFTGLARGMVILELNGVKITNVEQFKQQLEKSGKSLRLLMQYQQNLWYVVLNLG